jgi:hypothetical protein
VTTVTLRDHLAAQGEDATGLFSRGARVQKRTTAAVEAPIEPPTFVAVHVEPLPAPTAPRNPLCRVTHHNGHVLEFGEWPDASWLAALMGALSGPAR